MSAARQVDYDSLAAKYGGATAPSNLDDIAAKYGGSSNAPPASDPLVTGKGMEHPTAPAPVPMGLRPSRLPIQMEGESPLQKAVSDVRSGKIAKPAADLIEAGGRALAPLAAPALVTATGPTLGAAALGSAGGYLGRKAASFYGASPDQLRLVGDVSGVAGAAGGAEAGESLPGVGDSAKFIFRSPDTGKVSVTPWGIAHNMLERVIPEGELGSPENPGFHAKLPARMPPKPTPEPPVDPVKQAIREGRAARLPVRMPAKPEVTAPAPELGSPENPGFHAKLPTRMPANRPLPANLSVMPKPNLPGTIVAPEPRPSFPGENKGYMASIPRGRLPNLAASGKPGAGTQLQNLGKTVLYAPPADIETTPAELERIRNLPFEDEEELPSRAAD